MRAMRGAQRWGRPRIDNPRASAYHPTPSLRTGPRCCGMRDQPGSNLQSVRRALRALELISESGECGVTELGRKLGVHKATASRLVATLAERGFVERDPITEKYRLGFGLIALAGAAAGANDLVRSARPILEDL